MPDFDTIALSVHTFWVDLFENLYILVAMNENQRKFISDKLGTLGNITAGALIFGQFLSKELFNFSSFVFGFVFWFTCYLTGYLILKGGDQK